MNAKNLKLLIVLAVLAGLLAWWLSGTELRRGVPAEVGQALVPGLSERLAALERFRLAGKEALVTIERTEEGGFVVREKHGYPADLGKLRGYLLRLADARLTEPKTANPERFAELGVEDPAGEGAGSVLLELAFADGELALVIGRYNGQGSGTFVRRPGENQSWLASGDLTVEREAVRWIARELVDLPSGRVQRLALVRPDGETIRAAKSKEEDAHFTVENLPPGRELGGEWAATGLAGLLSALQVDDVFPAAETPVPEDALTLSYETFDARRYTMRLWKKDDAHFLAVSAELLPATAPAGDATGAAPAASEAPAGPEAVAEEQAQRAAEPAQESPPEADPQKPDREALAREVERFNAQVKGWVYRIPAWKYSAVDKRMEDLLKPKEG